MLIFGIFKDYEYILCTMMRILFIVAFEELGWGEIWATLRSACSWLCAQGIKGVPGFKPGSAIFRQGP